jgi:hypothetical protein
MKSKGNIKIRCVNQRILWNYLTSINGVCLYATVEIP